MLAHTTPWIDSASVTGSMSVEHAVFQAALKLFDERLEHLCVGGLNQTRGTRTSAICASDDIWRRSDLISSSNARSSRPSIQAATASTASAAAAIFRFSRTHLNSRHLQEDRRDQLVL